MTQKAIVEGDAFRNLVDEFKAGIKRRRPDWVIAGNWPTIIMRCGDEEKFKRMIADNKIPSAKLIGVDIDTSLVWQNQLDQLRAGVSPDLVVAREEMRKNALLNVN